MQHSVEVIRLLQAQQVRTPTAAGVVCLPSALVSCAVLWWCACDGCRVCVLVCCTRVYRTGLLLELSELRKKGYVCARTCTQRLCIYWETDVRVLAVML
jgi:hypothetical protein